MRRSTKTEQAAIQAVAGHFSAPLEEGRGPFEAYLTVAGKRIALVVTAIESRAEQRLKLTRPRLRFDRVALGLIDRLRSALSGSLPDGRTVIVTITAPIRLPSRTAGAMEERIRKLVATRAAPARLAGTIHRTAGARWLVIASKGGPVPIETCRHICSGLGLRKIFEKTLVAVPGERVATLRA